MQARFAGPRGCTHLEQLARALGPVVVQAVTSRRARAVSTGQLDDLLAGGGSPWARGCLPHLGRGRDRRPEAGRGLATGHGTVPGSPTRDVHRTGRHPVIRWRGEPLTTSARRHLAAAALVAVTVACTSCAASGTAISTPFATTAPMLERGPDYEVETPTIGGLGPVLVDGQGITVYLYESDRRGYPSDATGSAPCSGRRSRCRPGWRGPVAGPGIEPRLLGTAPRTDGSDPDHVQRMAPLPVAADHAPGKATGQGLTNAGGRWYVVDAAGNAVQSS